MKSANVLNNWLGHTISEEDMKKGKLEERWEE